MELGIIISLVALRDGKYYNVDIYIYIILEVKCLLSMEDSINLLAR